MTLPDAGDTAQAAHLKDRIFSVPIKEKILHRRLNKHVRHL